LSGIASIAAKFGLGGARTRSSKAEMVTEQNWRVELITTSGQDRWRVGDLTRGDARRPDGLLSGDYFLERKTADGESHPLCKLERFDASHPVVVTLTITASFGSLLVFPAGRAPETADVMPIEGRGLLRRRSKRAVTKHSALLAAHIAGLVLAKKIRNAQQRETNRSLGNEIVVAELTLVANGPPREEGGQ
jgi:hypothetical protein